MFRAGPSPLRFRTLSAAPPGLPTHGKRLDWQGGEFPVVNCRNLVAADFITYPESVKEGSNCGNCRFNKKGVCSFHDEGKGIDLRGQPVSDRNCCGEWDAEGTLRLGRRACEGNQAKSLQPVTSALPPPAASGVAVVADDTGRVLMLQRDVADGDQGGKWELPGGKIEGGQDPLQSAVREWHEETGLELPPVAYSQDGKGEWRSSNGVYQGYVFRVQSEGVLDLASRDLNSNPDGDRFEVVAWVHPDDFKRHNLREELKEDSKLVKEAIKSTEPPKAKGKAMSSMNVATGGALVGARPPNRLKLKRRGRVGLPAAADTKAIERAKDKLGHEFCYDGDKGAYARVPCGGGPSGDEVPTASVPKEHGAAVSGATRGAPGAPPAQGAPRPAESGRQLDAERRQIVAGARAEQNLPPVGNGPTPMSAQEMAEYLEGKQGKAPAAKAARVKQNAESQKYVQGLTSQARQSAKENGVDAAQAEVMASAVGSVLGRMGDPLLKRMSQALHHVHVVKDTLEVTRRMTGDKNITVATANGFFRPGARWGWVDKLIGEGREVVLASEIHKVSSKKIKSSNLEEGLAAHELSHAVDYDGGRGWTQSISATNEWVDAWGAEIDFEDNELATPGAEPISYYATTNPVEGFAEFGRALFSSKYSPADVERKFPKCAAVWRKHGIWPEG